MIAQIDRSLDFSAVIIGRSYPTQNPSPISLKSRASSIVVTSRLPSGAKTVAQDVLFDYLYNTWSIGFMDTDHFSKNFPYFLEKFHFSKNFPYFLEKLLPPILVAQRCCSVFGEIPKVDDMHEEAREIFGYEYGVLHSKLQHQNSSKTSCCSFLLIAGTDTEFMEVIKSLTRVGLNNDCIRGFLSGKYSHNWNKMLDMINFLEDLGYREDQMHGLFKANLVIEFEGWGCVEGSGEMKEASKKFKGRGDQLQERFDCLVQQAGLDS
ncbi:hypothetical protein Tsubulata_030582, partial [Turnera subulata]